jgi:hypothetical protein
MVHHVVHVSQCYEYDMKNLKEIPMCLSEFYLLTYFSAIVIMQTP